MKVIVCGGRLFSNRAAVFTYLDRLHALRPITEIAEGGALGADRLGRAWARQHGVPVRTFAAQWIEHGRSAGAVRNAKMLDEFEPDLVVAFPGGKGTEDMVTQAQRRELIVLSASPGLDAWAGL
ncbi:MAG: hypothetical protein RIS35_2474 [Pseudomonadota bacterium]|jgi:hypothetical protein